MNFIDLHTHSTFSDGTLSPTALIQNAYKSGLSAIALTDHDTIGGLKEAKEASKMLNIELINGVEISVNLQEEGLIGNDIHILGLGFEKNNLICDTFKKLEIYRKNRNLALIERFSEIGINITYQELLDATAYNNITKAHFAQVIISKGYASNFYEVFDKYFSNNSYTNIPKESLHPFKAIEIIHSGGGIAVLAHPLRYNFNDYDTLKLVKSLKKYGLDALEVIYSTHSPSQEKYLKDIAKELDLGISGGSDFHGDTKPGINIGVGFGNLAIPETVWEKLNERRQK